MWKNCLLLCYNRGIYSREKDMIKAYVAPTLSAAFSQFRRIMAEEHAAARPRNVIVFCEDRLSLVAERALCEEVGGSFTASVYTLSRFLAAEAGKADNVLSSQGSAMVLRTIIDANADKLNLLRRLSAAGAAQQVYDTIALLYSSGVSAADIADTPADGELLRRKLSDLSLLYSEYDRYLEEHGLTDRNAYLRRLPHVIAASPRIKGAHVLFLGFQAFTASVRECVRACMLAAADVSGLFIGGREQYYVNRAWSAFAGLAGECGRRADIINLPSDRAEAAEHLRKYIFDSMSFHNAPVCNAQGRVSLTVASDEVAECDFIASRIVSLVSKGGLRYREISVMLPDIPAYQPVLERTFRAYGIPFYADRRYPLISHPVCTFLLGYLRCLSDGCRLQSVTEVISSPLFLSKVPGGNARRDKDECVNYLLRAASSRGGIKRALNPRLFEQSGTDISAVSRIRETFLGGLKLLESYKNSDMIAGLSALAEYFGVRQTLADAGEEKSLEAYPSVAAMNARAYDAAIAVLEEAGRLTGGAKMPVARLAAMLRSGFTAAEISLIPPKQDAVFVGDLVTTANTGSKYLFAAGLTDGVPSSTQDTAILTDGELKSLEKLHLAVSPKISELNDRVREMTALNLCAFSRGLYVVYPLRKGGEECARSEVADYVCRLFSQDGANITPAPADCGDADFTHNIGYFSRPMPALRRLAAYLKGQNLQKDEANAAARDIPVDRYSAVYLAIADYAAEKGDAYVGAALDSVYNFSPEKRALKDGAKLYGRTLSPTTLETYFGCPYKCFMSRGLRLAERAEESLRPLDSGLFIHSVLENSARQMGSFTSDEDCERFAREQAAELLQQPQFSAISADKRGEYAARALAEEAAMVTVGAYRQVKNSRFRVEAVEVPCRITVGDVSLGGRIDRVDSCDDMVRIVDYKTGTPKYGASAYYMGLDLQLPLYLRAAAKGRRAAGAYYFPAKAEYSSSGVGAFTLAGFMDGSEEVIRNSDTLVEGKQKSEYVGAYLSGNRSDNVMQTQDFEDFLDYSQLIVSRGAEEMFGGNITPSPAEGACSYCKYGGLCGYDVKKQGARQEVKVSCRQIAEIVRDNREKGE